MLRRNYIFGDAIARLSSLARAGAATTHGRGASSSRGLRVSKIAPPMIGDAILRAFDAGCVLPKAYRDPPHDSGLFECFEKALDPNKIFAPSRRPILRDPPANFCRRPAPVGKHANVGKPARTVRGIAIDR